MADPIKIKITLNHKPLEVEVGTTVSALLVQSGFPKSVAVFVNKQPLLMKSYSIHVLEEADQVTVFRPLGGG